jgi:hypothetical protein
MHRTKFSSCFRIARLVGAHGMESSLAYSFWERFATRFVHLLTSLTCTQAVKLFTSTADDSDDVPNVDKGQPTYSSYRLDDCEWELLGLIKEVLAVSISHWCHVACTTFRLTVLTGCSRNPGGFFSRVLPYRLAYPSPLRRLHCKMA